MSRNWRNIDWQSQGVYSCCSFRASSDWGDYFLWYDARHTVYCGAVGVACGANNEFYLFASRFENRIGANQ